MRKLLVGAGLVALALVLNGCAKSDGGSGPSPAPGPTPGPPSPPAGPCDCPAIMRRGHCSACHSDGSEIRCSACTGGYKVNSDATDSKDADQVCVMTCDKPEQKPKKPVNVMANNGKRWPTMCQDQTVKAVFFGIGDWGGFCGWDGKTCEKGVPNPSCNVYKEAKPGFPCPMPNRGNVPYPAYEGRAQTQVSDRMMERNKELKDEGNPVQFIVNVGDNFYPGGIDMHCGLGDKSNDPGSKVQKQFEMVWKQVYPGELSGELEWWSVLGNHDYGGACYIKGWDQQIWYTYNQDKWVMPGQYWMRSVQYKNMKIDFFFVDGSWFDTPNGPGGQIAKHNICNPATNPGKYCELKNYPGDGGVCAGAGPTNAQDCPSWFQQLWAGQYKWLMREVPQSDADWQIVVTHYPGSYDLGKPGRDFVRWQEWAPAFGIDLLITGHTHFQRIYQGNHGAPEVWDKGTVNVITGGGGGVTTDENVDLDGQDDGYGYMLFEATLAEIKITTYSHGGEHNKKIARNSTTVTPVEKKSDDEIIKLGLDPQHLLKRRQIIV
jgi:hypothetical protein